MKSEIHDLLRRLPSVTSLLEQDEVREWLHGLSRTAVVVGLQSAIQHYRDEIQSQRISEPVDVQDILSRAEEEMVRRSMPSLRRVINATGIVLHTGLGRAPLCEAAIDALAEGACGYCNLEFDLESGQRGHRTDHVVEPLLQLTGAEAATVVNNNAAATLLILQTFAAGRETVVSRGQLIEIGGSFRLPDIMAASGTKLCEVGTTNRTRIADYERAINDQTAILLRVHTSNYRVVGFTEEVDIRSLTDLAHRHNLIAVDDLGSGSFLDLSAYGLPPEPCVGESIAAGADLVCFSGDKLLGGPQCGIILGKRDLIARINANSLMRTYRLDKLTLLALEATIRRYLDPQEAVQEIPVLAMLTLSSDALADRARMLASELTKAASSEHFLVCSDVGFCGGGSMPARELETVVVQWRPSHLSIEFVMNCMRTGDPPIVARVRDDSILFDVRTIAKSDFECIAAAIAGLLMESETSSAAGNISLPLA